MDPNANLEEQIKLATTLIESRYGSPEVESAVWDATRLAELVLALNDWIKKGGFLPTSWQESRKEWI